MIAEGIARQVLPLCRRFGNDGHWYALTSTSLGGSGLSAAQISERLETAELRRLVRDKICLPICFDADRALDNAYVVVGGLSAAEESEWIGRVRARLTIPCGEFLLLGGAQEPDFEAAMKNLKPRDPHYVNYCKFAVAPGEYVVDVYAYVGSSTVSLGWDGFGSLAVAKQSKHDLVAWWESSRPGQPCPAWLRSWLATGTVGNELGLAGHVIRLQQSDEEVPLPEVDADTGWCGVFQYRQPMLCPAGIPRLASPQ
jgi:hypothetical protein